MKSNQYTRLGRLLGGVATILLLALFASTMTACGSTWNWLWTRETEWTVDTNDLVIGDNGDETDIVFEGAVEYTGEAHRGTDIYYIGKAGSENRSRIVIIDAGHQFTSSDKQEPIGPDASETKAEVSAGATGAFTGQVEYELNLRVALLLRDELIRRGYSVVMIRETSNVNISNMERAQVANKYSTGTAAYIRIHANSWTDESMKGAMTISQSANNPYPSCAAHYEKSRLLSELILDAYCEQTDMEKLNRREMDNMTGTNWSRVPTTIVEMGFLSNKADDNLMKYEYFHQSAAIGIANGVDDYFAELKAIEEEEESREAAEGNTSDEPEDPVITPDTTATLPEDTTEPEEATTAPAEPETTPPADAPFEGAVEYTGESHPGTDIYYVGKPDSENRDRIVIIDPGHQLRGSSKQEPNGPGSDVTKNEVTWGATGAFTGQVEYELNLRVALHLRDELIARGYSVVMIRETNEVTISNMQRAAVANKYASAAEVAYVRIHANGSDNQATNGALTICHSKNNPYPTCTAHYDESRLLSDLLLDAFCQETGIKKLYRLEMDNMTGTNWSTVPTTILEMGFLSNEADDRRMLDDEFRKAAAVGVANGLDAYFAALGKES